MAAPDLETLLDFETNIEDAAKTFLETDTGLTATSIFASLDQDDFVSPRLEVMLGLGEASDPPDVKGNGTGELEYRKYSGNFMVRVISDKSVNGTTAFHRTTRAKVRASLLLNADNFTTLDGGGPATILPYYDVKYLRPTGTTFSADSDLAISELAYQMHFAIRNDAWPSP
jgi:hypothetical protein